MDNISDKEINDRAGKYVPPNLRREIKNDPSLLDKIASSNTIQSRNLEIGSEPSSARFQGHSERRYDSLVSRSAYGSRDGQRVATNERQNDRFGSFGGNSERRYGERSFAPRSSSGLPNDIGVILQSFAAHSADSASMWRLPKTIEEAENLVFGPEVTVGCDFSLYDDIPITTSAPSFLLGMKPDEIKSFDDIGLPETILYNIHRMGAKVPTPIQRYTIPICGTGIDVMASAPTGSGKTAAFLIPTITLLKIQNDEAQSGASSSQRGHREFGSRFAVSPKCLILSPTRELAQQIHSDALRLCWRTGLFPQCVHGGGSLSASKQASLLRSGCDILVATPGRLIDLLEQGVITLAETKFLVLDEADKMLEMGFEEQVRSIVVDFSMPEKHLMQFNEDGTEVTDYVGTKGDVIPYRQTLLFSATFPKEIRKLAEDLLAGVADVNGRETSAFISIQMGNTEGTSLSSIIQTVSLINGSNSYEIDREKLDLLLETINNAEFEANSSKVNALQTELHEMGAPKFLVFVETKKRCKDLEMYLQDQRIECYSIHGDKEQQERDRALKSFKDFTGRVKRSDSADEEIKACVMIATDVAQRGLHITGITHVVNFDGPHDISDYTHRVGRTGRVGHRGFAFTYLTAKNKPLFKPILDFLEKSDQEVPPWLRTSCSSNEFRVGGGSFGGKRGGGGGGRGYGYGRK